MTTATLRHYVRPILFLIVMIIALMLLVHTWNYYHAAPWTRDGRVRGDVVELSSDVSGLVTKVFVRDNQEVKKGQVLFSIDVARQQMDIEQAQADLSKAKAGLLQAQAALAQAQADVVASKADIKLADKTAQRYQNLMDGAISKQEQDEVFATRDQRHARHEQLQAAVLKAKANLNEQQALIELAQSKVNLAQLNLQRSEVVAPADGTLSNFELRTGNYVKVGQPVAALIDRKQLYVVGYFEETKLARIQVGASAKVQLMGDSQQLKGHVQGIATGIEDRERQGTGLLANVNPTFSWVRLAQRVPVKIVLDELPKNKMSFVAGRTATVHILEQN